MRPDPSSPESDLLLACAKRHLHRLDDGKIRRLISAPLDWPRFAALARRHRVVPLIHAVLSAGHAQAVPPGVLAELRSAHQASTRQSLFLAGQLKQLLQWLQSENIPAIPFKGPLLAVEAYGDLALRSSGDLDLLIHRRDILRARRLLIGRGFKPIFPTATDREAAYLGGLKGRRQERYVLSHAEHHLLSPDGRVNLDLHWEIALSEFALPLNGDRLWSRARTVAFAGGQVPSLARQDLLLSLCVNGAKDDWTHFDRVCDVAGMMIRGPQIDWPDFLSESRLAGTGRMVMLMLWLAHDLLAVPIPPAAAKPLAADPLIPRLGARIRSALFAPAAGGPDDGPGLKHIRLQLGFRDRWRDKIRYLAVQFCPTVGDWAAFPLPTPLHFLHYALRPLRLLLRGGAVR